MEPTMGAISFSNTDAREYEGELKHIACLDLRSMRSIEELKHVTMIKHIGIILLSESFQGTLASIPMKHVGTIITIPDGSKTRLLNGDVKIGGKFMENADGFDGLTM